MIARFTVFGICLSVVFLAGCAGRDPATQKGTPAFYWAAAKETYAAGDFVKTVDHLRRVVDSEDALRDRAVPWLLVMTGGLSRGYNDLADSYEAGARVRKSDPAPFRKHMSTYRSMAARYSLQFAESLAHFQKLQVDPVPLAFPYPPGSPAQAPAVTKVAMGGYLQAPEAATAEKRSVERGILLVTCRAAGAPNDAAKTQEVFKRPSVEVPRHTFVMALANILYDQSQLYSRRKLDEPAKLRMLAERALEILNQVPDSKEKKELTGKLKSALKENKNV